MYRPTRLRPLTLALALLAALCSAGPGNAQQTTPEACDPNPVDEVSSGHIALFDVYWDTTTQTLVTNPCPPTVAHRRQSRGRVATTRTASNINIGHTIIHIPDSAKRTVTENGTGEYDGDDYDFLRPLLEPQRIWSASSADVWIVPSCAPGANPAPRSGDTLCLDFSTSLLQKDDWAGEVQYEFESLREPGQAAQSRGDLFAFRTDDNGYPEIIWRSDDADDNEWHILPGTYDSRAYWAFNGQGTYKLAVHLKGHPTGVRSTVGGPVGETLTSVVRVYTFHVGDLTVNHDPVFEVERSVRHNAAAGTAVGDPIWVKEQDAGTLCFALDGAGAEHFIIEGSTDKDTCGDKLTASTTGDAQIQVKQGASLSAGEHDLTLQMTDGKDPEGNTDRSIDDSIAVQITVTN